MKILIIQTAFIGDVILATPLIEKLRAFYPEATIDFLVRKGNEGLLTGHPILSKVLVFDKKHKKFRNLCRLIGTIRKERYDYVINLQRFMTSGIITVLSGGKKKIGFIKNPMSMFFSKACHHTFGNEHHFIHEVHRNLSLIEDLTDETFVKPKLYPGKEDFSKIPTSGKYVCIAPASVWFTKQFPVEKWVELINKIPAAYSIFLLGAPSDKVLNETIKGKTLRPNVTDLAGKLTFLESAALMKNATMNFCNDSAPLHLASAVNAPVTGIYCSTVPSFGFTPLSDLSYIMESDLKLLCRPCGLHGHKSCPENHFDCADIKIDRILEAVHL